MNKSCPYFFILSLLLFPIPMIAQNKIDNKSALTRPQQKIVAISVYTADGELLKLSNALNEGLDAGLTINEIKEFLAQLYAYCGFPRSLQGINTFMNVLKEREAKGVIDKKGKEASPIDETTDKYERGRLVLEKLTQQPQSKPAKGFGEFSPTIDRFLKEHLFADIFDSDVLTYEQREVATISALASMRGVEPMLQSHISMGMNVGITESQLRELVDIISITVGKDQGEAALKVLEKVLENKK